MKPRVLVCTIQYTHVHIQQLQNQYTLSLSLIIIHLEVSNVRHSNVLMVLGCVLLQYMMLVSS